MKKLKVNLLQLNNVDVLTRQQLKNILGGDGSGSGDCAKEGDACNTHATPSVNCCSGLVCGDYKCWRGTL